MRYPAYPEYKKADIEWLKDIPKGWSEKRLRFVVRTNPVKSEINNLEDDDLVSFVPMEAVGEFGGISLEREKLLFEVYNGYTYFRNGDIVIAKITPCFENGKGAIAEGLKNGIGFGTTEFHVLRPDIECSTRFMFYLSMSHPFRKIGESGMLGAGGQKRISESFIKDFRIGLPGKKDQEFIADFLDYNTQQIDQLIEKKKALIEKLNEQRIAVITQAVTKGLDKTAKMKPSGVDWLGDVPEHWDVMKLNHVVRLKSGESITSLELKLAGEYPVCGGNGHRGFFDEYTHDGEYVLIGRQGALCGNINYVSGKFWASEHAVVVTPDRAVSTLWLGELLRIMNLGQYSVSAAQPGISVEMIARLKIPYPPMEEQKEIAGYISNEISKNHDLINVTQKTIESLIEYRTALITAAVTGKIDVRNIQLPQQEASR